VKIIIIFTCEKAVDLRKSCLLVSSIDFTILGIIFLFLNQFFLQCDHNICFRLKDYISDHCVLVEVARRVSDTVKSISHDVAYENGRIKSKQYYVHGTAQNIETGTTRVWRNNMCLTTTQHRSIGSSYRVRSLIARRFTYYLLYILLTRNDRRSLNAKSTRLWKLSVGTIM